MRVEYTQGGNVGGSAVVVCVVLLCVHMSYFGNVGSF